MVSCFFLKMGHVRQRSRSQQPWQTWLVWALPTSFILWFKKKIIVYSFTLMVYRFLLKLGHVWQRSFKVTLTLEIDKKNGYFRVFGAWAKSEIQSNFTQSNATSLCHFVEWHRYSWYWLFELGTGERLQDPDPNVSVYGVIFWDETLGSPYSRVPLYYSYLKRKGKKKLSMFSLAATLCNQNTDANKLYKIFNSMAIVCVSPLIRSWIELKSFIPSRHVSVCWNGLTL